MLQIRVLEKQKKQQKNKKKKKKKKQKNNNNKKKREKKKNNNRIANRVDSDETPCFSSKFSRFAKIPDLVDRVREYVQLRDKLA